MNIPSRIGMVLVIATLVLHELQPLNIIILVIGAFLFLLGDVLPRVWSLPPRRCHICGTYLLMDVEYCTVCGTEVPHDHV